MKTNRRPFVAGNWKLHKNLAEATTLVRELKGALATARDCEVCVAPVATALSTVAGLLEGTGIRLAAQNVHYADQGAFTGELSPLLLADVGCTHTIVGHSERRQLFGETDAGVQKKVAALLSHDLVPIICCGETLEQREAGKTLDIVLSQVDAALEGHDAAGLGKVIVAYEPIWAIGTGRTASAADAQDVHAKIRSRVAERHGSGLADGLRILYGGSVKPANAAELIGQADIDGALVGGASLEAGTFVPIVEAAG